MKKMVIVLVGIICFQKADAQSDSTPVYVRFPIIPIFNIMTIPDSTRFTKDDLKNRKPTMMFIFNPDCSHCLAATRDLLDHIQLFKKTQILMISSLDFIHIKNFYEEYKIADYPNITVGWDAAYYLGSFFKIHYFPSIFLYNKKGKFIKSFEGSVKMETIAKEF